MKSSDASPINVVGFDPVLFVPHPSAQPSEIKSAMPPRPVVRVPVGVGGKLGQIATESWCGLEGDKAYQRDLSSAR
jgi:hypothetical protein